MVSGYVIMSLILGLLYDVVGRRVPLMIAFIFVIFGQFMLPFIRTVAAYYISGVLFISLPVLLNNPWVPDLIQEKS